MYNCVLLIKTKKQGQQLYLIHSHNNRKQTINKTTIDMSDSEFSGFEEDETYDEEGLSKIFSDISIASELD